MPKVVGTDFGTKSKVLIMVFLAFKTFNLVPKFMKTFDLVPKFIKTFDLVPKFIKTFDLLPKTAFNLVPKLTKLLI